MSSTQTFLILGVIVVILIVLVGSIMMNASQRKKIQALNERRSHIDGQKLADQIDRLNAMSLSGESLASFESWEKVFNDTFQHHVPDVDLELDHAEEQNAGYKTFKAKANIKAADELLTEIESDLGNASEVFDQLLQSDHDNAQQLNYLLKDYQAERKNILSNSFKYGNALDQLENRLTELESDFDIVTTLSDEGDHVEAKRVLSRINMNITTLNGLLPKLEKGQQEVRTEFPNQLDEILDVYKQMEADKYNFAEINILADIRTIRKEIDQSNKYIQSLDVDELEKNNEKIAGEIDKQYAAMENEMKARKIVEKKQESLVKAFNTASSNSHQLIQKLDHIDQSYQLTHGELKEATDLDAEVNQMQSDFEIDQQKMADGEAVYSILRNDFYQVEERLVAIAARQKEISDDVDGLFEAEKIAAGSLDNFAQEVSLVKRKIDRQKLPGLPREFVDFYNVVLNEITDLNSELNQVRINLEQISGKLILVQQDINKLRDEADSIVDSARLVENAVQYANKFITTAEIKLAIQDAMQLYQDEFDYQKALDTIATALEKVEPGSFHRIEQDYNKEQNNNEK